MQAQPLTRKIICSQCCSQRRNQFFLQWIGTEYIKVTSGQILCSRVISQYKLNSMIFCDFFLENERDRHEVALVKRLKECQGNWRMGKNINKMCCMKFSK